MKKTNFIALIFIMCAFLSCNDDSQLQLTEEAQLKYSLISPDDVRIAKNAEELNLKITNGKGSILDVNYIKTNKNSLAAFIDYKINNQNFRVLLMSGIDKFEFPHDAIIKVDEFKGSVSKTDGNNDVFVSCTGGDCCIPGGYYDFETNKLHFNCKCENGQNSLCVVKVTSTAPRPEITE